MQLAEIQQAARAMRAMRRDGHLNDARLTNLNALHGFGFGVRQISVRVLPSVQQANHPEAQGFVMSRFHAN